MKSYRRLRVYILLCFALLPLVSNILAGDKQTLQTVSQVDLSRYTGIWYELARLPNRFQNQCVGDVTAEYSTLR